MRLCRLLLFLALISPLVTVCGSVWATGIDPEHRPIAEIRIVGLRLVPEQLVRNSIRSAPGEPYRHQTVKQDIERITHLGRFAAVKAIAGEPMKNGSVVLTFELTEAPLLSDVQVVGNTSIVDATLLEKVHLRAGDPAEPYLIDIGIHQITEAYEQEGFFVCSVSVDQALLDESGILIYQVREGPRVKIVGFEFQGNSVFSDHRLASQIKSSTYFPIFRKGQLSRQQLDLDAAAIRTYYQRHGYLDAQCGREIRLSPDSSEALINFVIDEGQRYLVDQIRFEGNVLFSNHDLAQHMALKSGSVYSGEQRGVSRQAIIDLYGRLGYIETEVVIQVERRFESELPLIDLLVQIDEGSSYLVGNVSVRGNNVTRSKVILRQVRGLNPGRRFDRTGLDTTRHRLSQSPLFKEATVTILGTPEAQTRDVLIEVKEGQTGQLGFGAGVSSDAGLVGSINLLQRNFDISNFPESFDEFLTGQAFRGAGQFFSLTLQPGNRTSRYSVAFREPYLFESDRFLDFKSFYFDRHPDDYEERRLGSIVGIGQRFNDVWSSSIRGRIEQVQISSIDARAPIDVFAIRGDNLLLSLGISVIRDSTDNRITPSRGSRFETTLEQISGDADFNRVRTQFVVFWTVDEDFMDRKSIVSWRTDIGYIFQSNEAPVFERLYAGGHRTFRGFNFRGVGPRGIRADTGTLGDDPVGDDWMFLTGLQYEFPLADQFLRGAVFTDQGTVQDDFGMDVWRISVGAGIRLKIPFILQAPLAIDVAYPVLKESGDEEQIVSFDLAIPLR